VAQAAFALGAGRERKGDRIDPSVGVVLAAKVGERVERGQPLATIHAIDEGRLEAAERLMKEAFEIGEAPVRIAPLIYWRNSSP
jgi:thymidine phosphorylase